MSEMIERVAKAIAGREIRRAHPDWRSDDVRAAARSNWTHFQAHARSAIAALREPTEAMIDAGNIEPYQPDPGPAAREVWRAMIDAALEEPK